MVIQRKYYPYNGMIVALHGESDRTGIGVSMIELALLGLHADGTQLVFTDPDGKRYLVDIDDDLKAAIRRQSLTTEVLPTPGRRLAPREIQRLLRAGMEPQEIASAYEIEIERINRYTSPVQLEKNFIISRALEAPISNDSGAPRLGELVVDRLATRGVDTSSLSWSAQREDGLPWQLHLTFAQAARQLHAHWEISEAGKLQRALDDEARWLTETTAPALPAVSTLTTSAPTAVGQAQSDESVEALLDELTAARGRRQGLDSQGDQPPLRMDAARQRGQGSKPQFKPSSPLNFVRYSRGDKGATSPTGGEGESDAKGTSMGGPAGGEGKPTPQGAAPSEQESINPDATTANGHVDPGNPMPTTGDSNVPGSGSKEYPLAQSGASSGRQSPADGARTARAFPSGENSTTEAAQTADSDEAALGLLPGLADFSPAAESSDTETAKTTQSRSKRAKRRSVPAWDEIIFGSRSDQ